ncbi:hypothetical protein [Insolitispirillum peregrinum]|uniref:hypothetical protein n=1 Tax=Insolitispirillum peregrinum TaxID=80876 RepID=UPI001115A426|nr:hypothetical protein [Insolitispirillum peregrinum]
MGEDGCNIDIKGNYADVQNTLREMQEKFSGTITPQQMSAKFDYQWMDVLKVNDSLEVKARPTADSTGTPTLEIRVKEQEGDAVYTIKVRAHP